MPSTAREAAATILELSKEREIIDISNLKLQKLIYYAQAWSLALTGKTLFSDPIQAWVHGPVVPHVFGDYKHNRWAPISRPLSAASASHNVRHHIAEVLRAYGALTATELERLSHSERPWIEARAGLPADVPSAAIISTRTMRKFYSQLIAQ